MQIKKLLSVLLVLVMIAGLQLPVLADSDNTTIIPKETKTLKMDLGLEQQLNVALKQADKLQTQKSSGASIKLLVLNSGSNITSKLLKAGAKVVNRIDDDIFAITIPKSKAVNLLSISGIERITIDRTYSLDPREKSGFDDDLNVNIEKPNIGTTLEETGVADFCADTDATGEGTLIAIIDTGVEPDHEFLRNTTAGTIKIVDWQDFTYEGDIEASAHAIVSDGSATFSITGMKLANGVYKVPAELNGKTLYLAELAERIFPTEYELMNPKGKDFNLDGDKTDYFPVIAFDSNADANYDSVIIDTDLDNDFTDEEIIGIYKDTVDINAAYANQHNLVCHFPVKNLCDEDGKLILDKDGHTIPIPGQSVNVVLTGVWANTNDIDQIESLTINIGFDGGSHGTHVSGIAAGYNPAVEATDHNLSTGVAPGANIMALKALGTNQGGAASGIISAMIYAAKNGADIVNMSLGSTADINDGNSIEAMYADLISEKYGTIFAISAGNNGPGINTLGSPGDATSAISSGAYVEADTWEEYPDTTNPNTYGLWYFSSIGPREDGVIKPTIISPGSAISSVPAWEDDYGYAGHDLTSGSYDLYQGTSMSSPYTAGVIALLKQTVGENAVLTPSLVSKALRYSGNKENLSEYQFAEIGGGLIDIEKAYEYIIAHNADDTDKKIDVSVNYGEKLVDMKGIYVRNGVIPSEFVVTLTNNNLEDVELSLTKYADSDWFSFDKENVTIPADGGTSQLHVTINDSLKDGLNSDCIMGTDSDGVCMLEIPVTLVKPMEMSKNEHFINVSTGSVDSTKYNRYFVYVPYGTKSLDVNLAVGLSTAEATAGTPLGRLRVIGFNPDGMALPDFLTLNEDYSYAGLGSTTNTIAYPINNPQPGMWELDVYASTAQAYDQVDAGLAIQAAPYTLTTTLGGVISNPDKWNLKADTQSENSKDFEFTNLLDSSITPIVTGTGLFDEAALTPVTEDLEFGENDTDYYDEITITDSNPNIIFNVGIESLTSESDDFDLYINEIDPDTGKKIGLVGQCADGDADEDVSLKLLHPGTYEIDINNYSQSKSTIRYKKSIINADGSGFDPSGQIAIKEADYGEIAQNESWTDTASITVPDQPNRNFVGLIIVKGSTDTDSPVLTSIPVNVSSTPEFRFNASSMEVNEDADNIQVTIDRLGGGASIGTIDYATGDITATSGKDYTATTGTLTFNPDETSKTINIPIIKDNLVEGNETFSVTLSNPTGEAILGNHTSTTITIIDSGKKETSPAPAPAPAPAPVPEPTPVPTPTPTPTPSAPPTTVNLEVSAPALDASTGTATVNVNSNALNSALSSAPTVVVEIPSVESANSYELTLPTANLNADTNTTEAAIQMNTNLGTLRIPTDMLTQDIIGQGSNVGVNIGLADTSNLSSENKDLIGNHPVIELNVEIDGVKKAWNNPDAPVMISIPYTPSPEEQKNPDSIVVWYIDGSGNVVTVPNGCYDPRTGSVTFSVTHFSKYAIAFVKNSLIDIANYKWANTEISTIVAKDIMKTKTSETFAPSTSVTRAEFVCGLVRALGLSAKVDTNFSDINSTDYYYNEIAVAKKLGITTGVGSNKFNPSSVLSRQDMMTLVTRALRLAGKLNTTASSDISKYLDYAKVASYARADIAALTAEGFVKGDGLNLNPLSNTSRAEAATILYRVLKK